MFPKSRAGSAILRLQSEAPHRYFRYQIHHPVIHHKF
jgi:hypothetical protein